MMLPAAVVLVGISTLLARQGDAERGLELYSLAARHRFVGDSHWFADAFGHYIERSIGESSDVSLGKAGADGENNDLWGIADALLVEFGIEKLT